ncbi:hypothetical protein ACN38_g12978 [Penicillium nordicum]|uniref:Uncharacterized protein n=1 Tax=Penicillium nordicum TaxID=229535 RepID=A0A0M8NXG7_9EURO|nr:hypothetical protein ACN38_g12978 [Penicillium nordicum]
MPRRRSGLISELLIQSQIRKLRNDNDDKGGCVEQSPINACMIVCCRLSLLLFAICYLLFAICKQCLDSLQGI